MDYRWIVSDRLVNCQVEPLSAAWTYNQGVILGAAAELYQATRETQYLEVGRNLAHASMHWLSSNGVLIEATDATCGRCMGDERYFKGAYMRNLRVFQTIARDERVANFIRRSADSAYRNARNSEGFYGFHWTGAFDNKDAGRQTSALDLMNALDSIE